MAEESSPRSFKLHQRFTRRRKKESMRGEKSWAGDKPRKSPSKECVCEQDEK